MSFFPNFAPSLHNNLNRFVLFRILFGARYYYPIFSVLFLDLGLTMEQFALLNVFWAASIICLEVPSGVLADHFGRKKLIVFATVLMILEMLLLVFAPIGGGTSTFLVCLFNRVLSGAAEACASGADEALAYDSLPAESREENWTALLAKLMKWQSAAFFFAMILGGLLYDPSVLALLGIPIPTELAHRLPVLLTLLHAVLALWVVTGFQEPERESPKMTSQHPVRAAFDGVWKTGVWISQSPLALGVLLAGLCFDSFLRFFLTVNSNYYRLIQLPESLFGLLGAAFALMGMISAPWAKRLADKRAVRFNFGIVALFGFLALWGASLAIPYWGLLILIPLQIAWMLLQFFLSHYLNLAADSSRRATVLSFKGLALNLGYGGMGLLFAALSGWLRQGTSDDQVIFAQTLKILPWMLLFASLVLAIACRRITR